MWLRTDSVTKEIPHSLKKAEGIPLSTRGWGTVPARRSALSALTLVLMLLQGCGFHLRGTFDVPPQMDPTYIQAPQGDPLARQMREALRSADVEVVDAPDQASAVLRLLRQDQSRRVRAVDQRGKVIDYELTYKVSFDVQDAEGEELVSPQAITLVRTQVDPGVEVLGKQEEQTLFFSDMQREMVGRILRRVKIQLR